MEKVIRKIDLSDAPAVRDIYAPFVSDSATSFEAVPPDAAEIEDRIRKVGSQYPWLVFEGDGRVLGYAYASQHRARFAYRWCVDVSVYVHADVRNCRIGTALYGALFNFVRQQGYFNAYAGITLPNPGSVRLHESLGFTPIGVYSRTGFKFGKWHDVAWLQLRLREDPIPSEDLVLADDVFRDENVMRMFERHAKTAKLD
jgi:phosphinothricin acetyltransferase